MQDSINQFLANMITAGAIVAGFCAVFLQFRIQTEADVYRQPGWRREEQQLSSSFLLIILASAIAFTFGIILPLVRLSGIGARFIKVQVVVAGYWSRSLY